MNKPIVHFLFGTILAWILATVLLVLPVTAQPIGSTYVVNSTDDTSDADLGNPACADVNGKCTLRAAIMQANFTAGADTIILPAGVYVLTRSGDDDQAVLGDLDINDDLTIQGTGSGVTIVDGNGAVTGDRVFQILTGAKNVTLSGLTIRNGKRTNTFDQGGGLYWDGNGSHLNLSDVVFEGNKGYYGGGLYLNYSALGDTVDLNHVIVRSNTATAAVGGIGASFGDLATFALRNSQVYSNTAYEGGGLYFQHTLSFGLTSVRIENTEVYSNTASFNAGIENRSGTAAVPIVMVNSRLHDNHAGFYGGAIGNYGVMNIFTSTLNANLGDLRGGGLYNYETGGQLNLTASTLSGNVAQYGGGIYSEHFNLNDRAVMTITNSTLSGNVASRDGGGLYADGGQINLLNATIAANSVLVPMGLSYTGMGGGLYITNTAIVRAQNTLLGDNQHRYGTNPTVTDDCFTESTPTPRYLYSLGYDLIEDPSNCTVNATVAGNIYSQDPKLGPLQNNGGSTQTQALLQGSPAIDAGNPGGCLDALGTLISTDQRGAPRPFNGRCDIGAFEFGAKLAQTITFGALPNKTLGDPPFALTASASSGLAVTYTSTGQCTVLGNTVTLTGVGSCRITAHQPGDSNYTAASDVSQSFTILVPKLFLPAIFK